VLAAYGELPDDQEHALALHLQGCAACREEQEQLMALKTLATAYPMQQPDANLVARSRRRLEDSLDLIPPKRWYDRVADWMTRTANGLQSAPVAACLLLVAGAGLGSMGGYWYAQRPALNGVVATGKPAPAADPKPTPEPAKDFTGTDVAGISGIVRKPDSNEIEVTYNQVEPRTLHGTLENPQVRQLVMMASENGTTPTVRDKSIELLAAECSSGHGCQGAGAQGDSIRDALMVALRYDRSATVREKALSGLQPYIAEDMNVRNAVLEALLNDPDAHVRSAAISMLQPVEADTSVRQVLSTVALSDQNSNIRNASRVVLRRVSEVQ
jgi:hypothetical protein